MSAATVTRGAIVNPARATTTRRPANPRPAQQRYAPAVAGNARACVVARPAEMSQQLSERGLLAIMVGVALVFLFGLVVMVQGFWAVSQAPEASPQQPAIVVTR